MLTPSIITAGSLYNIVVVRGIIIFDGPVIIEFFGPIGPYNLAIAVLTSLVSLVLAALIVVVIVVVVVASYSVLVVVALVIFVRVLLLIVIVAPLLLVLILVLGVATIGLVAIRLVVAISLSMALVSPPGIPLASGIEDDFPSGNRSTIALISVSALLDCWHAIHWCLEAFGCLLIIA